MPNSWKIRSLSWNCYVEGHIDLLLKNRDTLLLSKYQPESYAKTHARGGFIRDDENRNKRRRGWGKNKFQNDKKHKDPLKYACYSYGVKQAH